ncbi:hypothetical protein [Erwinia rhapontici]|uniref:hypothetical protein n=1 Tax=Erwinia rhapontici TaxID=55212 RepID=UPI003BA27780
MGWELHITRAEHWWDGQHHPIDNKEWVQLVNNDDELSFDPINGDHFALWKQEETHWLELNEGRVSAKRPEQALYCKMLDIAVILNASVMDEEDRIYRLPGDLLNPPSAQSKPKLSWRQKMFNFIRR